MIGHTQPRRIAARSRGRAHRPELGTPIGPRSASSATRCASPRRSATNTLVKLMTDGILLAEIQSDPQLRRYDTIIVDEAHERSLNIDFILGYLARLLPAAPGPEGHHHLGDHRLGALRRALRPRGTGARGPGAPCQPAPVIEVLRAHLPRRDPLPPPGPRTWLRRARPRRPSPGPTGRRPAPPAREPGASASASAGATNNLHPLCTTCINNGINNRNTNPYDRQILLSPR